LQKVAEEIVKRELLVGIGCLALALGGCKKEAQSSATTPPQPPPIGVGVAAAADSATRFELWLLSKQPDQTSVPTVQPGKIIADSLKDVALAPLLMRIGMTEWQARIQWAWDDMGPMEPEVQKEIAKLDGKYTATMYGSCVWPGTGLANRVGRACVSQSFACYAARNKMDEQATDIMLATQLYDNAAVQSIRAAGPSAVGEYLRVNKFCK
jgi:hypothetical protein